MKKLFNHDPLTGITQWFHSDGENHTIYSEQDIEPELEAAQALRNEPDYWDQGVKKSFVHYAHIPNNILELWLKQGVNINEPSELIKMVNKPEYQNLKLTRKSHGLASSSSKHISLPKPKS